MKALYLEGALYMIIAVGAPVATLLSGNQPLSGRTIAAVCVTSFVSGCTALKAFLSTSYSRSTADAILVREPDAGQAVNK